MTKTITLSSHYGNLNDVRIRVRLKTTQDGQKWYWDFSERALKKANANGAGDYFEMPDYVVPAYFESRDAAIGAVEE